MLKKISQKIRKNRKQLLITFCFSVFTAAIAYTQTFNFSVKNKSIPETLRKLSEVSGKNIAFSERFFPEEEKISLSEQNTTLESCLKIILDTQPVDFKITSNRIVLFKRKLRNYTISGYLSDAASGERLIYANIFTNHGSGTTTNEYGFFSLTLPEGKVKLSFSYIGYKVEDMEFHLKENQKLNIKLPPSLMLSEVIVTPTVQKKHGITPEGLSVKKFSTEEIRALPDFGGEADIVRAAAMLPGIQTGTDGTGGLYVRGGDADQNLMLLDGVPVYHSGHMFNMFSIYNTHAVKSARFIRSGFPARYGGRLSSVMDVRTREGNLHKWSGSGEVGLISSKVTLEGPLQKEKGAVLVSGRVSNLEYRNGIFASQISTGEKHPDDSNLKREIHFFDINAKMNYDFGKDRLYLSYYFGKDRFLNELIEDDSIGQETNATDATWGNQIFALRYNRLFSPRLFANTTLTYTNYKYLYEQLEEDFDEDSYEFFGQLSDIRDVNINSDFDFRLSPKHYMRFGMGATFHSLTPAETFQEDDPEDDDENEDFELEDFNFFEDEAVQESSEGFIYFEDEMQISPTTQLALGLRLSGFLGEEFQSFHTEPRFFLSQKISSKFQINASATRMVQYLHRALTTKLNLPAGKWIPSTEEQKPETSWQETLGFEYNPEAKWTISSEVYHKTMKNQIIFDFEADQNPQEDFFIGSGRSYGWETMIEKRGKTGGNINYTLASANREYEDYNSEKVFPFQFDRRHSVKAHLYHKFDSQWRADITWSYFSPNPIIPVLDRDSVTNDEIALPESDKFVNKRIKKPIHRLDISGQYSFSKGRWGHHFKASIFNVYNAENIHFNKIKLDSKGNYDPQGEAVYLFGIQPSLSYRLNFN